MTETERVIHEIPPVWNENSRVLILGSFPSVKSREGHFFYNHPQNRFWKVLASILDCPVPRTIEEKKQMLLSHGIAVWDVIASCQIQGSSDNSIREVVPNDLSVILSYAPIVQIYANGTAAWKLYEKYIRPVSGREVVRLPSTSPANAAWQLDRLTEEWKQIKKVLSCSEI